MNKSVDLRRLVFYVAFAFGIAWSIALIIYLNGGLANSPVIVPGTPITLALVLLAGPYMFAPTLAHVLTRWLTKEGWSNLGLRPLFRQNWKYWLAAWFLPGLLTVAGAALYFLLFPQHFDANLTSLGTMLQGTPQLAGINLWLIVLAQILGAMVVSPIFNSIATFGEEFGWRGYLLPKLLPSGWRKAVLWSGLIWGVWHWPVIFMGYEYGFEYPGFPWIGPLLFMWIAFCFGTFLSWLALRGRSVWPAVIGHAAINGIAAIALVATTGNPNPLLGPLPVGIIGSLGYAVVALVLYWHYAHRDHFRYA